MSNRIRKLQEYLKKEKPIIINIDDSAENSDWLQTVKRMKEEEGGKMKPQEEEKEDEKGGKVDDN